MKIIGIGTDITEISRIERMFEKHGDYFLNRIYTEEEIQYSRYGKHQGEHLAGRWAAKEAVLKALGTGWITGIDWKDVEVRNNKAGKPEVFLSGGAKKLAENLGGNHIMISITHSGDYAVAFAVLTGND